MKEVCKRGTKIPHQTFFPLNYSLPSLLFLQLSFSSDRIMRVFISLRDGHEGLCPDRWTKQDTMNGKFAIVKIRSSLYKNRSGFMLKFCKLYQV